MTHVTTLARQKTFDIPHKGLRSLLAQLSLLAGNTDFSDPEQLERLEQTGNHLFRLLTEHAADEDQILLAALEQRCPGAALANQEEHEIIEQQQARLMELHRSLLREARQGAEVGPLAEQFYFDLNRFQSAYLLHMLEEEQETQAKLWRHFSDSELMALRLQIIGRMAPASLLLWFRYSAPAMSQLSRLQWVTAVKGAAPAPFFKQIMETLKEVLPNGDFRKLMHAVSD